MAGDASGALLVSVTDEDAAAARRVLPGARLERAVLGVGTSRKHPDAEVLSVMVHDDVTPAHLEGFQGLQAIVTRSCGFDHLPLEWLRNHRVRAYALGGYATQTVAHFSVGLILMLLYRAPEAIARTRAVGRQEPTFSRHGLVGRSLGEVTIGVVGTGRIGGTLARILSYMGARVLGYDISPDAVLNRTPRFAYVESLEALLSASDVVSLHVPLTDLTRRMIDAHALGHMRPGSLLVNTCRGEVVDQAEVAAALRDGRLAGYAADMLPGEPVAPDLGRFRDIDTALLTPHLAAYNNRTIRARYETTGRIIQRLLSGRHADIEEFRVA